MNRMSWTLLLAGFVLWACLPARATAPVGLLQRVIEKSDAIVIGDLVRCAGIGSQHTVDLVVRSSIKGTPSVGNGLMANYDARSVKGGDLQGCVKERGLFFSLPKVRLVGP